MVCISRRPDCGTAESDIIPDPLKDVLASLGAVGAFISTLIGIGKALGVVSIEAGIISVGGVAIGGAAANGVLIGAAVAIIIIITIGMYALDRCVAKDGLRECFAGVVQSVTDSFGSGWDQVFPFSAMHDRVDLVVKSRYWDAVEDGQAFVFCTDHEPPMRSEIMRCYFFDSRVCDAATGAQVGAAVGGVAAVIAAAAVAAAIGCATVILCIVALIVAAIVAAVAVLVGALIGGQAAKAASENDAPGTAEGGDIAVGHLVTIRGNMVRREHDQAANVLYFATSADFHGMSTSPQPFTYCDINDELEMDGCERTPEP